MTHYRLYFHDSSGHFARGEDVDAANDAQAIECAKDRGYHHSIEVWQRARRVGIVEPEAVETR